MIAERRVHRPWYAPRSSRAWLSCPAGTFQSPIRIKAEGRSLTIRPWPLAHQRPRKPSVPNRAQFADRLDTTATTVKQDRGLQPPGLRQPLDGSRPGRTRLTMPLPLRRRRAGLAKFATVWPGALTSGKTHDERFHRPARSFCFRIGDGGPIRTMGSRPDPFPGSPLRP